MSSLERAVVVGSGAGGLAAAAYLAKQGFDVLLLEQKGRIGGFLAPIERDGFRFDPGLHYAGMCRPGQMLYGVLADIGIDPESLFSELDPDGFDVLRFPDLEIRRCRGTDAYRDRLLALFPEDERGLARLFEMGKGLQVAADAAFRMMEHRTELRDLPALAKLVPWFPWVGRSLSDLLETTLGSCRARTVLAAQSGHHGLPPSRVSALGAWMVLMHYGDGAFFPRGGSGALSDALAGSIKHYGGTIRVGETVRRILVERRRVSGVELASGERIAAGVVVSDVEPTVTFGDLVGWEHLPAWFRRKLERAGPSRAILTAYLGMRRDLRQHGLGRRNLWLYPTWDLEGSQPASPACDPPRPSLFLTSSSLNDTSGSLAPAGCSTLEITTVVPFWHFDRWHALSWGRPGMDARAVQDAIADWMLREVEERCSGLIGDVLLREVVTPLGRTDEVRGEAHRSLVIKDVWDPFRFRTKTPVRNLFLVGAGVWTNGVAAALASGRQAALAARVIVDRI